jgi:hypothetical protein
MTQTMASRIAFLVIVLVANISASHSQGAGRDSLSLADGKPLGQGDFFVATDGSDSWSCTRALPNALASDGPCATLAGVRDKLRLELGKPGGRERDWRVIVRGGTYWLDEKIAFGLEDTPARGRSIIYEAYPGETPIVSGGRVLNGFEIDPRSGFWKLSIPEVAAGNWYFGDLWVNSKRSRWPIYPPTGAERFSVAQQMDATGTPPFVDDPVRPSNPGDQQSIHGSNRFGFNPGELDESWTNFTDVRIQLNNKEFYGNLIPIASIDAANRTATLNSHVLKSPIPIGTAWRRENVYEDLTSARPGEHYLDRTTGILTYVPRPNETPENSVVVAPVLEELVRITNGSAYKDNSTAKAGRIKFRSITFAHSNSHILTSGYIGAISNWHLDPVGAVTIWGADEVGFDKVTFEHIGECGIVGIKARRLSVTMSSALDLGACFVIAGDEPAWNRDRWGLGYTTSASTEYIGGHNISNNHIRDFGITLYGTAAILVGRGIGNKIIHNTIHDGPGSGIINSFAKRFSQIDADYLNLLKRHNIVDDATGEAYIAYNHIYDLGMNGASYMSDFGAIYNYGPSRGTIIEFNKIHDIKLHPERQDGVGIYLDDESSGLTIRNNLVYGVDGRLLQIKGINHKIYNNIFYTKWGPERKCGVKEFPLYPYYWKGDFANNEIGMYFHRNIVAWEASGKCRPSTYSNIFDGTNPQWAWRQVSDYNIYYQYGSKITNWADKTSFAEWRASYGNDRHSLIDADPRFRNRGAGDFRLRPSSPALKLGFVPFDLSSVGVQR